ncbi:unnamed protein product [Lactuca saligna]|uniref:DNA polymerase alpha subunit B n=1 Tax=Lactuca saligna TaxID=75948 RepID=A0AA35YAR2_LACSI|nr:unnamed protein product [Lactuca saligna]
MKILKGLHVYPENSTSSSKPPKIRSPSIGAVTLLALRNCAPDVFPYVAAVGGGNPRTGFDTILSAETFVSALFVGFVVIYAVPFFVSPAPFIRDVLFYLTTTLGMDSGGKLKFHPDKDNKPTDLFDITSDLSLIIASGPYTTTDNLLFEPLSDLLAYAQRKQPQLHILLEPFIDLEHPKIKKGALNRTYDDLFHLEILRRGDAVCRADSAAVAITTTDLVSKSVAVVDRDTSTSATIIALASGLSESNVMQGLAKSIAWDGEGATSLIEFHHDVNILSSSLANRSKKSCT